MDLSLLIYSKQLRMQNADGTGLFPYSLNIAVRHISNNFCFGYDIMSFKNIQGEGHCSSPVTEI